MNLKEIKELINLMNENNLSELEIEREGANIKLKKSPSGQFEATTEEHGSQRVVQTIRQEGVTAKEKAPKSNLIAIKAPMVGTFYRSSSPDAKSYVEIGAIIEVGQTICIIEAMKLMNEIKSEVKGKIAEILVENANSIEYGQSLFMVEPL